MGYIGVITHLLTIDPNFLGHPSRLIRSVGMIKKWRSSTCPRGNDHIHPRRLTWNLKLMVWKLIFLFKQVVVRFHVNLPGCIPSQNTFESMSFRKKPKVGYVIVHWYDINLPNLLYQLLQIYPRPPGLEISQNQLVGSQTNLFERKQTFITFIPKNPDSIFSLQKSRPHIFAMRLV